MELNLIARTVHYYCFNQVKRDKLDLLMFEYDFTFQMSAYYKHDFLIHNYQREGCFLTYYEGVDLDDKMQVQIGAKAKFTTLTYPTGDKKDFLYQVEIINMLSQTFPGQVFDPKSKKIIPPSEVKFLY